MKLRILSIGIICAIAAGCAAAPKARVIQDAFPIEGEYDKVWAAVVETFAELQIPIDNMEKDSGLITTDWIDFSGQTNEDYCDCGSLGINTEVNRTGRFNVFVRKVSEKSCEMRVNTMYEQRFRFGNGPLYKRTCVSTGNLEKETYAMVVEKLNR